DAGLVDGTAAGAQLLELDLELLLLRFDGAQLGGERLDARLGFGHVSWCVLRLAETRRFHPVLLAVEADSSGRTSLNRGWRAAPRASVDGRHRADEHGREVVVEQDRLELRDVARAGHARGGRGTR